MFQLRKRTRSDFIDANSLKLNADKTELVAMTKGKYSECTLEMVGQDVISQTDAKCLGVWWRYDLSPEKSVDECIHKARRAFFALGSIGAFHGRLNPLTGRSLFETFVVPTMLYGCETWILSETHLRMLESFQAEIGKHILGISKYHANTSTLIGLHWPSVKARILLRKLTFLAKVLERDDGLSSHVFRTLASEDVYNVSLVQQCRSLEQHIGTNYLQLCLRNPIDASSIVRDAKEEVLRKDWMHTVQNSQTHGSLSIIASSETIAESWNSLWDEALDFGTRGTRLMQGLFGALSTPTFGDRICRHCNATIPGSYSDHLFSDHITKYNHDSVVQWLESKDFKNLFKLAEDITSLNFLSCSHS